MKISSQFPLVFGKTILPKDIEERALQLDATNQASNHGDIITHMTDLAKTDSNKAARVISGLAGSLGVLERQYNDLAGSLMEIAMARNTSYKKEEKMKKILIGSWIGLPVLTYLLIAIAGYFGAPILPSRSRKT